MRDEKLEKELGNVFREIAKEQYFFYNKPNFTPDKEGNIVLICKYSFGPIEHITYGINKDGEYYFHWVYPEFWPGDEELETEHRIIDKEEMLRALKNEINVCKKLGEDEMVKCYEEALERLNSESRL